jgi:Holliday junction resolvase-like predicted endonuclease
MRITKSSRHSKIAGVFGEMLVLYWLSKYGFECASVDHTGIDLIARNPHTNEVMGISVKSRTRTRGTEAGCVNVRADEFDKVQEACRAFGCRPYFAVVIDAGSIIRVFITSLAHFVELCPPTKAASYWRMSEHHLALYEADPQVMTFQLSTETRRWWGGKHTLCSITVSQRAKRGTWEKSDRAMTKVRDVPPLPGDEK